MSKRKDFEAAVMAVVGSDIVEPSVLMRLVLVASRAHDAGRIAGLREAARFIPAHLPARSSVLAIARELAKKARAK